MDSVETEGEFILINGQQFEPDRAFALAVSILEVTHQSLGGTTPRVIKYDHLSGPDKRQ